jgi:hypothetical protein
VRDKWAALARTSRSLAEWGRRGSVRVSGFGGGRGGVGGARRRGRMPKGAQGEQAAVIHCSDEDINGSGEKPMECS